MMLSIPRPDLTSDACTSPEVDREVRKFYWLVLAAAGFLVSGVLSCMELRYSFWGKVAEAQVLRTYESANRYGRYYQQRLLAVEYVFTEADGTQRIERDDVPIDWPAPGVTVAVQYIPGVAQTSRLAGDTASIAVWIFLGFVIFLVVSVCWIAREANGIVRPKRRRA